MSFSKEFKIFMKLGLTDDYKGLTKGMASNEIPLLSQRFLQSRQFEEWDGEYYDIVVLGNTHSLDVLQGLEKLTGQGF